MSLSVVIVNYNTRELLRQCLHALQAQTIPLEIIVVDNASSDESAAMVREAFPQVKLLTPAQNTWFCGGNNLGIAAATQDYVLLLNPDTVPAPDALAQMLGFLKTNPAYAGCSASMSYPNGTTQRTCSQVPTLAYLFVMHSPLVWLPGLGQRVSAPHWYAGWDRESDRDVAVVPGSCTLMRREEIWLDDSLKLYFPEDDLARRIGRPFRFISTAHIVHHEKAATQSWMATRIYFSDLFIYVRKHHGRAAALALRCISQPLRWAMRLRRRLASG